MRVISALNRYDGALYFRDMDSGKHLGNRPRISDGHVAL